MIAQQKLLWMDYLGVIIFQLNQEEVIIYLSENDYLLYTQGSVDLIGLVGEGFVFS